MDSHRPPPEAPAPAATRQPPRRRPWLVRVLQALVLLLALLPAAHALHTETNLPLQARYWIDPSAQATIAQVSGEDIGRQFRLLEGQRTFQLEGGALWLQLELPVMTGGQRWYVMLTGAAFLNRASLFSAAPDGSWREQHAGDHLAVARWDHPNPSPLFEVPASGPRTVWLRLENQPAPTSAFVRLLDEQALEHTRQWTYLLVGGYLGFGVLVFVVGIIHARLYRDLVFDAYCVYVACMLLFQMAFTGLAGVFLWPGSARLNDAAPAVFMMWMTAAGIWFVREATALSRHSRRVDRASVAFSLFGLLFPVAYVLANNALAFKLLNLYGLCAVLLSISLCLWTWRRGEAYSGWLFLGFLPVHLSYPFPALRAAGVMADSWFTQYAVLIGSALEIPLLLYILHRRAKDFSENRARLRALDSTDPLTGLTVTPVLRLRLRDALRRAARSDQRCAVLMVELVNHADIAAREGREAGDRALVVAASRLAGVARDLDTVCRVADTRFALLMEGPQTDDSRRQRAQHIIARGLEAVPGLPPDLPLRLRVVSALVPDGVIERSPEGPDDEQLLLQRLSWALDRLLEDPKKAVMHLEPRAPQVATGAADPAPPPARPA